MKARESGMPAEDYWESFFDADCIIRNLECAKQGDESVVELGCGYGTFTIPVAQRTSGIVHAFDIEAEMVDVVRRKAGDEGLENVQAEMRDFVAAGTGLEDASVDHVMVYNLLHLEEPVRLLKEAYRILHPGGHVSIIHWKYDSTTPRGPSMNIRPRPEQCRAWAEQAGFEWVRDKDFTCCCHHYGLLLRRPS
jgi:ubiquinone/menaquinone biosynthesis C-methylase UbiE